jgi:hypothetical protein
MASAMMGVDGMASITDQVQFLTTPQAKPGSGKIKGRAIHQGKAHRVAIKTDTRLDIGNMDGDMIEFNDLHGRPDWNQCLESEVRKSRCNSV